MDSLSLFFKRLEAAPGGGDTIEGWRRACGPAYAGVRDLLRAADAIADCIPSTLVNAPDLRVVVHSDGSLSAVCDQGLSPRRDLDAEEVVLCAIAWDRLRKRAATALGLRTATTPTDVVPGVIMLGYWEPQPATSYPVVFAAHPDAGALRLLIRDHVHSLEKPAIVMTPTGDAWSDDLIAWVRERRCLLVVADDVVEIEHDEWVATDLWSNRLECFEQIAGFTRRAGTQNKRKRRRDGERLSKDKAIKNAVLEELGSRVQSHRQNPSVALPAISQIEIAHRAGCEPWDVTRAKKRDQELASLIDCLNSPECATTWWETRRSAGAASHT